MHILEVDDLHRQSVVHPGCVVIPTVISLGIREGLSGRKMLEAVLKGFEACTRIGSSVGPHITKSGTTPQLVALSEPLTQLAHC